MAEAAIARNGKTKNIWDINRQTARMSILARLTGDYDRFERAMNIATNYRANIRSTPEYKAGRWENGVYSGTNMRFPRSVYARRNNRRG